jgi:integrase
LQKVSFTDLSVRALKPPAQGQTTVWDAVSPLGIRISNGGAKTFIVMVGSGQRRTIGKVGLFTLAQARTEARRILAEKTLGFTSRKPASTTFEVALSEFIDIHHKGSRPRTRSEAKRLLEQHFLPAFRHRSLADITDQDITLQLNKLSHVPSEQLHAFRALRTMLRWATRPPHRHITHSPLEGYMAPGEDRKGTRILTDKELAAIWYAATDRFGTMVRLLILWGARNGEIGRLRLDWIDGDVITIPSSVTKNHRDHAIPILPMAREVLDANKTNHPYFFQSRWDSDDHFADGSWGKLKLGLAECAGVQNWQLRDIRRTFRSAMPKLGVSREVAERLINHVSGKNRTELDEIYDRYDYLAEKRDALARWEAHLQGLLARAGQPISLKAA